MKWATYDRDERSNDPRVCEVEIELGEERLCLRLAQKPSIVDHERTAA